MGLASPVDFSAPDFNGIWVVTQLNPLIILAMATAVLGMVLAVMNLYTIINYRLQPRVYNIFFITVMILTLIALCVDWKNLAVYLPLLNITVAVQVAHIHTLRTASYRYVFILLFTIVCISSCVANLMLS